MKATDLAVSVPNHRGFGTRLFLRALEQFGGNVDTTFAPTGLVCKMNVPLSEDTPSIVPSVPGASTVGSDATVSVSKT